MATDMANSGDEALRLVFWESTCRCNLACAHCRRLDTSAAQATGDLTTKEARRFIDSAGRIARPVLVFSGGEPLLRNDWEELALHARAAGLPTALASNGTLIDADVARRIAGAGFQRVSVSLDAAEAAAHDAFRGSPGAFAAALAGAARVRDAGVPIQVNATVHAGNIDQLDGLHDLAVAIGAVALHLFVLVPVGCGLELAEEGQLSPPQCQAVLEWVVRRQAAGPIELKATCAPQYARVARRWLAGNPADRRADRVRRMLRGRGCLAGVGVLFVGHAGEVFPCGYLPVSCGNVRERGLEDIWRASPVLARLRDPSQLTGRCGRCADRSICGGCRARAFSAGGDYLAEEPLCSL